MGRQEPGNAFLRSIRVILLAFANLLLFFALFTTPILQNFSTVNIQTTNLTDVSVSTIARFQRASLAQQRSRADGTTQQFLTNTRNVATTWLGPDYTVAFDRAIDFAFGNISTPSIDEQTVLMAALPASPEPIVIRGMRLDDLVQRTISSLPAVRRLNIRIGGWGACGGAEGDVPSCASVLTPPLFPSFAQQQIYQVLLAQSLPSGIFHTTSVSMLFFGLLLMWLPRLPKSQPLVRQLMPWLVREPFGLVGTIGVFLGVGAAAADMSQLFAYQTLTAVTSQGAVKASAGPALYITGLAAMLLLVEQVLKQIPIALHSIKQQNIRRSMRSNGKSVQSDSRPPSPGLPTSYKADDAEDGPRDFFGDELDRPDYMRDEIKSDYGDIVDRYGGSGSDEKWSPGGQRVLSASASPRVFVNTALRGTPFSCVCF
ncbi:uncharacterized protein L969DRAFT_96575 [Mixia osmundae IAM 14324]|uniref:Uncharacterized protein n=1 Tax=Mixia osmundae (strain CBS 9802 / IAM 14324 / JCM 22182 / KY 12970) TaxID=764103 RepID=G7EAU8_MIXOS|nr:uncharacterized protein L969DRAFT_96575 [Mixia osmundae IAM 14324]KEI36992.1 hypothetical protein L969DRAFT_96575 [Mixia osmundae IAM 14324]GAA99958.1 hypothetical protein E5Q_06661 [Mixia osmundae IAM 14324]